ncbi:hypothetical protein MRU69_13125 [Kocuria flava]|uniref:hypothetical protein n=1 Tax=Kocuria flava TaxID=446860 RepID=UPI000DD301BB|nr:hypothetical protein [Kocuria flava]MCJ8505782.1 hypothetical protein [Kocuria flava]
MDEGDRALEELVRAQTLVRHLDAALTLASVRRDRLMVRARDAGNSPAQIISRSRVYAIRQRAADDR